VADWAVAALAEADRRGTSDAARTMFLGAAAGLLGMQGDAARCTELTTELLELAERTGAPVVPQVACIVPGVIMSGRVDLGDRVQALGEASLPPEPEPWVVVMSATYRAATDTYLGRGDTARAATLRAQAALPADFSPSMFSVAGWLIAMHSGAPRAEVARHMEHVIEQARLGRSTTLRGIYRQYHSSVLAELGDLRVPLVEAADNLERVSQQNQVGLGRASVRRAAVLLLKTGEHDLGARLLGWVDSPLASAIPATADLAAELEVLQPAAERALGAEAYAAARADGALMDDKTAISLCLAALRAAAEQHA
jgi:hypothetical protein